MEHLPNAQNNPYTRAPVPGRSALQAARSCSARENPPGMPSSAGRTSDTTRPLPASC